MAHTSLASLFSDIADAIRAKTGGTAALVADNFPTAIGAIPSLRTATASKTLSTTSRNLAFSGLPAKPKLFYCWYASSIVGTTAYVSSVFYDGTSTLGYYNSTSSNGKIIYSATNFSYTYSNGTLTVKSASPYFQYNVEYHLLIIY